jgi:hypothetical protein
MDEEGDRVRWSAMDRARVVLPANPPQPPPF